MKRFPLILAAALLGALVWAPPTAAEEPSRRFKGWSGPKPKIDCYCRHKEGRAALGETVCILRGDRRVLARCEKPQNLPFWRILAQDCEPKSS